MFSAKRLAFAVLVACFSGLGSVQAENEGQEDLDQATQLQLSARSLNEFERVILLAESALEKGLEADDTLFAKQLLVGALWQHASQLSTAIFDQPRPHPRWPMIRRLITTDLDKITQHDPEFADAYVLRARLETLPRGDLEKGLASINRAIELFAEDKQRQSEAYVQRARLREDQEDQFADLAKAIDADPSNAQAWQLRAALYISQGDLDKAVQDFQALLEQDQGNVAVHQALAEALMNLEKYDLSLDHLNKAIELAPQASLNYTLRAQLHEQKEELDAAVADLNQALRLEPGDPFALLARSRLNYLRDDLEAAREDVELVLQNQPGAVQAILLRSMISAAELRFDEAIDDLQMVLRENPENYPLQLQMAQFMIADSRPRKAITVLSQIIKADNNNAAALRTRGDALLSVGKHAEAIEDYEQALKIAPDDDGILNNLAWVLATSPKDELRDGERAIVLATKACEVTDYKMPHILSTLGAAFAESGDFEKAIEWSSKAVELGREDLKDQVEQLEQELESYRKQEPWRELQDTKEKLERPSNVIET